MGKLTATAMKASRKPGRYGDGDGLFLVVSTSGSASWVVRVQKAGRRRDIGIGSAKKVSLATAREKASVVRSQMEAGLDPVAERRKAEGIPTFREAAAIVFAASQKTWRSGKHQWQWMRTLEMFAFPTIGDMRVSEITASQIHDVLALIWLEKPETARRVRQRIGMVLDWAYSKGFREAPQADVGLGRLSRPNVQRRAAGERSMTEIAEPIDQDEWLSAAEALRRVGQVMGEFPARLAICARAFDGLVRTRAQRFVKHRQTLDDADLPAEFWWAKGHAALKQNWVSGDFSTWINQLWNWKAYGVRFHRDDIRELAPGAPTVSAFASMVSAREAVRRLTEVCGDREEAARSLFRYARVGAIPTSARFIRTEPEDGEATVENDRLLQVEDWRGLDEPTAAGLASGTLSGSYHDPVYRCTNSVELIDLRFDPNHLGALSESIPISEFPRRNRPADTKSAGRRRAEWWDDLLIEMFRRLWEDKWTPRTQAELVVAMHNWLIENPGEDPNKPRDASDSALKVRAKKLFEVLDLGQK